MAYGPSAFEGCRDRSVGLPLVSRHEKIFGLCTITWLIASRKKPLEGGFVASGGKPHKMVGWLVELVWM